MKISVIVPAYQQASTIYRDLAKIEQTLKQTPYDFEIITVVDGGNDNTFKNAANYKSKRVKVLGYNSNRGKGFAIRYGMSQAKGDLVSFIDAGMDLKATGIKMLIEHLHWYDADIIVGSKRHPVSKVNYPPVRRVLSFGYQMLVRLLFGLRIKDTQAGIKVFRRQVLEKVLPRLLVKQFAFDIEILAVAHRLGYKRIFEAPIELNFRGKSVLSQNLLRIIFLMLWDTLAVFYRLKILGYYDSKNRRKWILDPELDFKINTG